MMSAYQRDLLNRKRVMLVQNLQVTESLLACLREDYTLTVEMQEIIEVESTSSKRVGKLIDILSKRGGAAFDRFIYAIVKSGQDVIANELDSALAAQYIHTRNQQQLQSQPQQQISTQPTPAIHHHQNSNPGYSVNPVPHRSTISIQSTITAAQEMTFSGPRDATCVCPGSAECPEPASLKTPIMCTSPPSVGVSESERTRRIQAILDKINDGPFMEFTVKFTSNFDQLNGTSIYSMKRNPRGWAVIINNKYFLKKELLTREGASFDVVNLCNIFEQLHFETEVYEDLTAAGIRNALEIERSRASQGNYDMFILFILSHGTGGYIFGNDGEKLSIEDDIAPVFDGHHCPALRGKPKVFFIQACQGEALSSRLDEQDGPELNRPDAIGDRTSNFPEDLLQKLRELSIGDQPGFVPNVHEKADVLMVYATTKGYQAWRRVDLGSWFVRCLVYVLSQHAHEKHLLDMLTETNEILSHIETQPSQNMPKPYRQISRNVGTLTKSIFFLPGYFG